MAKVTDLRGITPDSIKAYARRKKFAPGSREHQLAWQVEHNLKQYNELRADILEKLNELYELTGDGA